MAGRPKARAKRQAMLVDLGVQPEKGDAKAPKEVRALVRGVNQAMKAGSAEILMYGKPIDIDAILKAYEAKVSPDSAHLVAVFVLTKMMLDSFTHYIECDSEDERMKFHWGKLTSEAARELVKAAAFANSGARNGGTFGEEIPKDRPVDATSLQDRVMAAVGDA